MKLKSYFLSLLAICILLSCSKEEIPGVQYPDLTPDATLSLAVNTGSKVTKAANADVDSKKDVISTLLVAIFYMGDSGTPQSGKMIKMAEATAGTSGTITEVKDIPVKSGNLKVLILANIDSAWIKDQLGSHEPTLANVLSLTTSLDKEKHGALTMSSKVMDVTVRVSTRNYMGYGAVEGGENIYSESGEVPAIKLYRNVARVELVGLELLKYTKFGEAVSFHLDTVFVANVKSKSCIASEEAWGAVEAIAGFAESDWWYGAEADLDGAKKMLEGGTNQLFLSYNFNNEGRIPSYYQEDIFLSEKDIDIQAEGKKYERTSAGPFFYVYENMKVADTPRTLLVVRGDYTYIPKGALEPVTLYNRFYTITVNEEGKVLSANFDGVDKHSFVKRNTKYNISINLAGPGSDNPYTPDAWANMSAKIEVRNWNVVDMDEDVD